MGWKSTVDINRDEAKRLILMRNTDLDLLSNKELADMVETLGYGDDPDLEYYGRNFIVVNN